MAAAGVAAAGIALASYGSQIEVVTQSTEDLMETFEKIAAAHPKTPAAAESAAAKQAEDANNAVEAAEMLVQARAIEAMSAHVAETAGKALNKSYSDMIDLHGQVLIAEQNVTDANGELARATEKAATAEGHLIEMQQDAAQAKLAGDVTNYTKALRIEAATIGMTAEEAARYKFEQQVATEAQLQAIDQTEIGVEQSRAHQAAIEEESRAIDDQAAAWQRLVSQGIAAAKDPLDDYISTMEALNAALAEGAISQEQWAEAEVKANERAAGYEKQHNADLEEGRRLAEQMRTPFEKYADELARIDRLKAADAIGNETAERDRAAARDAFDKSTMGKGPKEGGGNAQGPAAELKGSEEAWTTIMRSMQKEGGDAADKTAANTAETAALLKEIAGKGSNIDDQWEV